MGYKVDSLQLELTVTAKQTASSLNRVANALVKIKKETKDMSALVNLRKELNKFSKVNLTPVADALKTIASSSVKAREKLSNMLAEVDKKATLDIDFSPAGNAEFLESFTDNYDELTSKINENTDSVMQEVKATKDLNKEKIEQSEIEKKIANEVKKTTKEIDKSGIIGKKAMNTLKASFDGAFKGLKRFAKYAGYRAIRTAFNAITTSFSEGLKSAYLWSAEAENGYSILADTMDEFATSISQVKRQLGAVAGEVFQKLSGAINAILNGINAVADALTEFFAALNGEDTYMRAKRIETTWQDVSDSEKDATKAAKDYKKELLGIDELNVLGKDKDKGSGAEIETPKETEYELAKVNRKSFAFKLGANIKDILFNWDDLNGEQIALKICGALGALTGFVIGTSIGGVMAGLKGAAIGFVLGAAIGTVLFDADKAKYAPNTSKDDIEKTVALGLSGAGIGLALGGPLGAALGFTIGVGAALLFNTLETTIEEAAMERYLESDFKKELDDWITNTVEPRLERSATIKANIDKIVPDLSSAEVTELETAKKLVIEIFDLDGIENKTPEQIEELKTKIELLNGLNIDGVQLEFDDLTNKVVGSKDATLELIDSLLRVAKVKAGEEKLIELYKNQYDAKMELVGAEKDYEKWQGLYNQKQNEYNKSTRKRITAETNLANVQTALRNAELEQEKAGALARDGQDEWVKKSLELNGTIIGLRQAEEYWTEQVKEASIAEAENKDGLIDLEESESKFTDAIDLNKASLQEAGEKTEILTGLIIDERKEMNKDTKAVGKNDTALGELDETTDKLIDTTGDLKDGLKDVKDQMGKTKDMSPKLQKAIDGIKGSFNNLKTSIAESISELGKLDEAGKTKRTIELEYAVGANMSDAAMLAMYKGVTGKTFASGGFPEGGHLFFANENGNPEYIGNMGGRTAVANSDQMSAAIEQAAYAGMARALQQYGNSNSGNNWEPMSSEDMYLMLKKKATSTSRRTGVSVAF